MSKSNMIHVPRVDVGVPPTSNGYDFQELETVTDVRIHGFAQLPAARNDRVESPEFDGLGHRWRLLVYPGGNADSADGMVGVYLMKASGTSVDVAYSFVARDAEHSFNSKAVTFGDGPDDWGAVNFGERSNITDHLDGGILTIEVRMRLSDPASLPSAHFVPENPFRKSMLRKFMDEETADVAFAVSCGCDDGMESPPEWKGGSPLTIFHAHRLILEECAPILAETCKPGRGSTPVPIRDVEPVVFRHLLFYAYGGRAPDEDLTSRSREIIDAADKYGVVGLKLEAEACHVRSTPITIDNAIDSLLYADGKNCALLKEAVMDFLVENGGEAAEKLSFEGVPGRFMKDLLTAVHTKAGRKKRQRGSNDSCDYGAMRVGTLRMLLHEKGLGIDGSREAMIALLRENSSVST